MKKKMKKKFHKLKTSENVNVRVIAVVWKLMQKQVYFVFVGRHKKGTCKQMNHSLLLHAMLQNPYQPSTVNS